MSRRRGVRDLHVKSLSSFGQLGEALYLLRDTVWAMVVWPAAPLAGRAKTG